MADANQLFVTNALTRAGIAEDVNDYVEQVTDERPLADDDDRLTDALCYDYASKIGSITADREDDADEEAVEFARELAIQLELIGPND